MASRKDDTDKRALDLAEAQRIRADFDRYLAENNTSIEEELGGLKQFQEDNLYLDSISDDLVVQYADCWVGVYRKEVIAVVETHEEFSKQVSERGLRVGGISRRFLSSKPIRLIV